MSKLTETLLHQRLLDVLDYNPETGAFVWKIQLSSKGKLGSVAGAFHIEGYRVIKIDGVLFRAHRLAWFYVYATWPRQLDHKDGNRNNNCIANLREATTSENAANSKRHTDNKSGFKGVKYRLNKSGIHRWTAMIGVGQGRKVTIGIFDTGEEASAAYLEAAKKYFGEFARSS
jgi:hypothetical protein